MIRSAFFKTYPMKKIIFGCSLLLLNLSTQIVFAQSYDVDALKLSQPDLYGSASSMGAGGAFSTVGGDPSSLATNPAGLGIYRAHEIAVSPGYNFGTSQTNYLGQKTDASSGHITFPQASIIFASKQLKAKAGISFDASNKLKRIVFGIGYNRIADLNRIDKFSGKNFSNSMAQTFADDLNKDNKAINLENYAIPTVQAWQTYVVDTLYSGDAKIYPRTELPVIQRGSVTTKGALSELNLALAANINDVVYIGVGVGVPFLSYSRKFNFYEGKDTAVPSYYFNNYEMNYNYTQTGFGVNGKFGIIVKPVSWFRIGAAFQTPSYYRLQETTQGNMASNFTSVGTLSSDTSQYYQYSYVNPLKLTTGASFYLKQWGFISVDYELANYNSAKFGFDGNKAEQDYWNKLINGKYRATSTVKVGAVFAFKSLRVRGGFAWSQSPFKSGIGVTNYDGTRMMYTAGLGYRGKYFFADLAYVRTQYKDYFAPYTYTTNEPGAFNKYANNNIVLTVGFKFGKS